MSSPGANAGFVDELFARYQKDPFSVSDVWREFFSDYEPPPGTVVPVGAGAGPAPVASAAAPGPVAAPAAGEPAADRLTGAAARIAENMEMSLGIPTATSARTIPVKLLEENRRVINQHQLASSGPKVSFTHLIVWAIVRSLDEHPSMNAEYVEIDGKPHVRQRTDVNVGLAVDTEKRGQRLLVVPNIKRAQTLSFPELINRYNSLATRARQNKLDLEELTGTTLTLTNPGMLGTAMSVPRLMRGQGTIIGAGRIDLPPEYAGMSPRVISELGLSKVMTVTSTYDHRIIQGAESGAFLADVEKLLLGANGFYERIFEQLGVPQEPLGWAPDQYSTLRGSESNEAIVKQASVLQLIRAYRVRGHLWADLNPLGFDPRPQPELDLSTYGLSVWDLDREFVTGGLQNTQGVMTLRRILDILRASYCGHVGVEYMHIPEFETRAWLQERIEGERSPFSRERCLRLLGKLNDAEAFEKFLHTTYVGQKRFSLEGGEALIPMLDVLFSTAADDGVSEAIVGMAHRGRLSVMANILNKSVGHIFRGFEGELDPDLSHGSGDVKYHIGATGIHVAPSGNKLALTLASNPSHLEAVDPVVEGMVRARQQQLGDSERQQVLPVLIHGDAAFSGQGVVLETLNLSQLVGYRTGGTIHIVVNNQIGFTTDPAHLRSSLYATDVAKAVQAPIFHVNGDHPEDVARVIELAFAFRREFKRDVVVDMLCYRRWGHNEGDDPSYTNPTLYARIQAKRSVRKLYTEDLLRRGELDGDAAEKALEEFRGRMQSALDEVKETQVINEAARGVELALALEAPPFEPASRTSVSAELLDEVLTRLDEWPPDFEPHPKLARQLARRRERLEGGKIDWGMAEAFAFASLVVEGVRVRLSGEDSGRGTFSHRHAILYDHRTAREYVPLCHLRPNQAPFSVYDSLLSEFAVLGFEYGYSVKCPDALVMWEAQFGDFINGAQVIIDQFVTSAESKWGQASSVVLLLPHGYEGQGPEHSSARMERFLQQAAHGNIRVCNPTTPAQYFHLLRQQAKSTHRVPLVVFTPKSLLRHPVAVSRAEEFTEGGFEPVLDDPVVAPGVARRIVVCTGKLFYDLLAARSGRDDAALLRLEQLYPVPHERVAGRLRRYGGVSDVVWAQEEPSNMGAWQHVRDALTPLLAPGQSLRYVGRPESASPATGSSKRHRAEQERLVEEALV
jgi:2-oxoglutarate dehydrogenase E1 component